MTPVAVFAYNRPGHVASALESLSRCDRLDECRVHVFCDGPKGPEGAEAVAATRAVVREWAPRLKAEVIEREHNLGLARSIVTGVTDLCERYGRVIVVEDDLVVSPDFLDYMLQALDRYADAENVYQVSGFMHPVRRERGAVSFFLPLTVTWGWATWKRAWRSFDPSPSDVEKSLGDPAFASAFDPFGDARFANMLRQRLAGLNDSWGILWYWVVYKAGGLVLYPARSLVLQCGFDGSGTHCGDGVPFDQASRDDFTKPCLAGPLTFPDEPLVDRDRMEDLVAYMGASRPPRKTSLKARLLLALGGRRHRR